MILAIGLIAVVGFVCATYIIVCDLKLKTKRYIEELRYQSFKLKENGKNNFQEQNSSSASTSEKESDKDGIKEEKKPKKVFIAHPAIDKDAVEKWQELSCHLERLGYKVFKDKDSKDENDRRYCINHLSGSDIIIILVGNTDHLLRETGVFRKEIKHISLGFAKGKITYVCSYGTEDVLEVAVKDSCDSETKMVLKKILENVKQHSFNLSEMEQLAKTIDESYKKSN